MIANVAQKNALVSIVLSVLSAAAFVSAAISPMPIA